MSITARREDFECSFCSDLEDRDIECPSTEVIDCNPFIFAFVYPICESCRCRLIYDALYIESCDLSRVDSRLTFRVIEIRRDGDDCFVHLRTEKFLSVRLEFFEDLCRDLFRTNWLSPPLDHTSSIGSLSHLEWDILDLVRDFRKLSSDESFC